MWYVLAAGMKPERNWIVYGAIVAAALCFVALWYANPGLPGAFDIYMYYYPNMLYAVQRLHHGGSGLLWNPWQNCGQPSFGISSTGLLYPANLFFLLVDPDRALLLVTAFNLSVAGISAYALSRELGTGRAAALGAAFAFEFSCATIQLNAWGPQMAGSYVWLPAAMLCCERLLRAPRLRFAIGLGIVLALPLLTGFPQVVFFTYQLIALRVLFEFVSRRFSLPWLTLRLLGFGMALAPLLTAVLLVPGIEAARLSVRGGDLSPNEINVYGVLSWSGLARTVTFRWDEHNPLQYVPAIAAMACWLRPATRRTALFYALAGALYFTLAFGPKTPLFRLYMRLPLGSAFRMPVRFMWMTSFCGAVLTGLGLDALLWRSPENGVWRRWSAVAVTLGTLLVLAKISPNGLRPGEWLFGGAVVMGVLAGTVDALQGVRTVLCVGGVILGVVLFNAKALPSRLQPLSVRPLASFQHLIDGRTLDSYSEPLQSLRTRLTAQERAFFVFPHGDFSLMPKTGSLFSIPVAEDYEPQAISLFADYFVFMETGAPRRDLSEFYFVGFDAMEPGFSRRLLDLAAVRYVVAASRVDNTAQVLSPPLHPVTVPGDGQLTVYENPQALPRAFYVPSVEVVPDASALLQRLAYGRDDLRRVALVEQPPSSGFTAASDARPGGEAEIIVDEPEHVVVRVSAPARGFLHLADQYFPGWRATVNGAPAPILRANYAFRAVEVPAGTSTVEFRYRPVSVLIGAAITAITLAGLAILAFRSARGRVRRTTRRFAVGPAPRTREPD